jgi:hypothetical protein
MVVLYKLPGLNWNHIPGLNWNHITNLQLCQSSYRSSVKPHKSFVVGSTTAQEISSWFSVVEEGTDASCIAEAPQKMHLRITTGA